MSHEQRRKTGVRSDFDAPGRIAQKSSQIFGAVGTRALIVIDHPADPFRWLGLRE